MSHTSGMPNTKEAGQAVAHYRNGKVMFRGAWLEGKCTGPGGGSAPMAR